MVTLIVVLVAFLLVTVGGAISREQSLSRIIRDGAAGGQLEVAFAACERFARDTLFHSTHDVQAQCELLAYERAKAAVGRKDYREAVLHINRVIENGLVSGVEESARALAARLPDEHVAWIAELIRGRQIDKALGELAAAGRLYQRHADVAARVQALDVDARIERARQRHGDSDPIGALRELARLDPDSIRVRIEALGLLDRAVADAADHFLRLRDSPALVRYLVKVQEGVVAQPYLARRLEQLVTAQAERVFGVARLGPVALHVAHATRSATSTSGEATLVVHNGNGHALECRLVGPDEKHVTILPRRSESVKVKPGEYAQLVHSRPAGTRPLLRVVVIEGTHEQHFRTEAHVEATRS